VALARDLVAVPILYPLVMRLHQVFSEAEVQEFAEQGVGRLDIDQLLWGPVWAYLDPFQNTRLLRARHSFESISLRHSTAQVMVKRDQDGKGAAGYLAEVLRLLIFLNETSRVHRKDEVGPARKLYGNASNLLRTPSSA